MDEFNRKEDIENLREIPVIKKTLEFIHEDVKELKLVIKPLLTSVTKNESDVGWAMTATKWLYLIVSGVVVSIVTVIFKR